jgi:hypothetical protein
MTGTIMKNPAHTGMSAEKASPSLYDPVTPPARRCRMANPRCTFLF